MQGEPTRGTARSGSTTTPLVRLALASGAMLGVLLLGECALRVGERFGVAIDGTTPRARATDAHGRERTAGIPDAALYRRGPQGGVVLRPDARVIVEDHAVSGRSVEVRTNALGFRGRSIGPRTSGRTRILALGDSVTLGDYVDEDETWPAALERALHARGIDAEVWNGGVGSIGVDDMLPLLAGPGRAADPDLVVVGLYLNDAQRSLFLAPPAGFVRHSRLLSLVATRTERLRALHAWDRVLAARQPALDAFLAVHPVDAVADWRSDPRGFDREIAAAFADWGYAWSPAAWDELERGVAALRQEADSQGVPLVVVLFPVRFQVEARPLRTEPQRAFAAAMDLLGLRQADPLDALRAAFTADPVSLYYDHCHYTPRGNEIVAEPIAEVVQRELAIP